MNLSEIAILYRTNAQSVLLQRKLEAAGVPCRVQGGTSFYKLREVRDILAILKWITNPSNQEAIIRASKNLKLKIGEALILRLYENVELGHVELANLDREYQRIRKDNSRYAGLDRLFPVVRQYQPTVKAHTFLSIAYRDLGIIDTLREEDRGLREDKESFKEESALALLSLAKDMDGTVQEFLDMCELQEEKTAEKEAVILSTIHKAKGQEYDFVFVLGCSDKIIPHDLTYQDINRTLAKEGIVDPSRAELESTQEYLQELNLMYVAQTRARHSLVMTHSETHQGYTESKEYKRSPFISAVLPTLKKLGKVITLPEKPKWSDYQLSRS